MLSLLDFNPQHICMSAPNHSHMIDTVVQRLNHVSGKLVHEVLLVALSFEQDEILAKVERRNYQ